ncbi:hypothetical protein M5K25_021389 [Dendrobium thyrsiflorum]|uniref:BED-type domain-containing protein n=1 Tax=Dendrobium thyrsiflorum TaxID=117978 RepID=A0ABD0UC77_DENTH
MVRNKDKAASCHRKDPAWKYSTQVDVGGSDKTYVYLKCNYCDKVVNGGVTRMKEHLSGSHKNVAPCSKVPDTIREEIKSYMNKSTTSKHLAQKQFEDRVDVGSYYGSERSVRDSSSSMKPISSRGKRKITEIEEGVDWETLDSIEEEGERAVQHNDDSNEDPLSDDSADDL